MKAHSETNFENKNMFSEKWKVINPFLKEKMAIFMYKLARFQIKHIIVSRKKSNKKVTRR